ncbi:MAG: hypothetical protein UHD09_08620 [Bifidobacterium sp.]|nr:hypothetical protein [Bifidobacterium sp.]
MQHFWRQLGWTLGVSVVVTALFLGLAALMDPGWSVEPLNAHMTVTDSNTTIRAKGISTPQEGAYKVKETKLKLKVSDGVTMNAIVREPVGAHTGRPGCVFVHGAGTGKASEAYGDLGEALASAGITTIVQDKRLDNYTTFSRDYDSMAEDYLAAVRTLRSWKGVDAKKVGVYAESEGTWITTIMAKKDRNLGFLILTSAPVYSGRQQMAMAATEYLTIVGAPTGIKGLIPRLTSLDFSPFGLKYADFDAADYLDTLTMPLLINYGTHDPSMPIEQGAQQLINDAHAVGNDNVTVRYYPTNHQMRTGSSLSVPGLPLADRFTHDLEDWVNAVGAGTKAGQWETPTIAGSQPYQEYAVPTSMKPGLVSSVMALIVIFAISLLLWIATVVLCVVAVLRRRKEEPVSVDGKGRKLVHRFATLTKTLIILNIIITPVVSAAFIGYFLWVANSALSLTDHTTGLAVCWTLLRIAVIISILLMSWMWVRLFFFYGPGQIDRDVPKEQVRMSSGHSAVIACCSLFVAAALVLACFFGLIGID